MCRSDLFYHMAEFHNFDAGDPDNLGMITILLLCDWFNQFLIFFWFFNAITQHLFVVFCVLYIHFDDW